MIKNQTVIIQITSNVTTGEHHSHYNNIDLHENLTYKYTLNVLVVARDDEKTQIRIVAQEKPCQMEGW